MNRVSTHRRVQISGTSSVRDESAGGGARKPLDEAELRTIRGICEARSWASEWSFVSEHKKAYEQEGMRATLGQGASAPGEGA